MADFLAGSLGGTAAVFVGHPFDTIKVRLQTSAAGNETPYRGLFNGFHTIIRQESVSGLYKGLACPLAGSAVLSAIMFGTQKTMSKLLGRKGWREEFIAGCVAGSTTSFITAPVELAKIQMQVQNRATASEGVQIRGPLHFFYETLRKEGIRGPFRGLWLTIIRSTPGNGVYFCTYYSVTRLFLEENESVTSLGPIPLLISGACSGIAFWLAIYPIDYVKSRLQAEPLSESGKYSSTRQCIKACYKQGGLRIFYQGMSATLFRAIPSNAALLTTVTCVTKLLEDLKDQSEHSVEAN